MCFLNHLHFPYHPKFFSFAVVAQIYTSKSDEKASAAALLLLAASIFIKPVYSSAFTRVALKNLQ